MKNKSINPPQLFDSQKYGFSQVVMAPPGKMVFISGQVSCDENLNIVGANNFEVQVNKALDNVQIAIESAGGKLENISMLRIYVVKYQAELSPVITKALISRFGPHSLPASTWIGVDSLANKAFMIEIEAQAVI